MGAPVIFIRDPNPSWDDSMTLEQYVRKLLDQGKRSTDAEFKQLFSVFGFPKIKDYATKYLKEKNSRDDSRE